MKFRIDVHHHFESAGLDAKLDQLTHLVRQQGDRFMATAQELKDELIKANDVTNEIATDIQDLIAKLSTPGISEADANEVKAQLEALTAKLQGVAAQHTPDAPEA